MSKVCRVGLLFSLLLVVCRPVSANTLSPVEAMRLGFLSPQRHVTYHGGDLYTNFDSATDRRAQGVGVDFVNGLGFLPDITQGASFGFKVGVVMNAVSEQDSMVTQRTGKGTLELFDAQGELMLQASIHPGLLSREADDLSNVSFFATMTINGGWLYEQEIVTMGGPIYEPSSQPPAAIRLDLYDLLAWDYQVSSAPCFSGDYTPFLPGVGATARANATIYANPGPGAPGRGEPIPEPATAVLLLSGMLGGLSRRQGQ